MISYEDTPYQTFNAEPYKNKIVKVVVNKKSNLNKFERFIDKLIGKNSRISLADENLSLTDIDIPRQIFRSPLSDTPIQAPPLNTPMPAPISPVSQQTQSTQANTYASLFPRDELGNLIAQKKNI